MVKTLRPWSVFLLLFTVQVSNAQTTTPAEGIRKNTPAVHALTNARIVQVPGKVIEKGTLVMRDGMGRKIDLSSKHTMLYEKYKEKYRRKRR